MNGIKTNGTEITKEEIVATLKEFFEAAMDSEKKKRYKAAITLYYKALIEAADFLIFSKMNKVPRNHSQRFRWLRKQYKDIYTPASDLFKIYRATYNRNVTKQEMEKVKAGLIEILFKTGIIEYLKKVMKEFEDFYL